MYVVSVPSDKNFTFDMLKTVHDTYMYKMLHYICRDKEENDKKIKSVFCEPEALILFF